MKKSSEGDISRKIKPIEDTHSGLASVFYGRPGTGKTALARTYPKPLLLLDILQEGTDTLNGERGIDVVRVTDWNEIEELYWYLAKGKGKEKFKSVFMDQITEAQDVAMASVREDNNKDEEDLISKRMWGQISGDMKRMILEYRGLIRTGKHVAFLAHERSSEGEEALEDQIDPSIGPRLMPSVQSFLNGAVKVIGNTFIRETFKHKDGKRVRRVDYCMRIGPHAYYTTKIRHPVGFDKPDIIVDPSFDKIMAIVKGQAKPAKKPVRRLVK